MLVQSLLISKIKFGTIFRDKFRGYIVCNGENLPFRKNIFETAVAFTVIQNLSNMEKGLSEIKRVLKDDAKIGISVLKKNQTKLEYIHIIRNIINGIKSFSLNAEIRKRLNEIAHSFNKNNDLFIQNSFIEDIMNIEDFFFFTS